MAVQAPNLRGNKEVPVDLVATEFDGGLITQLDEARLSLKQARESLNLIQDQDGLWTKRPGTAAYGQDISTSFDNWGVAVKDDGDGTTTNYLFVVDGGTPKRSVDGGAWTTVSGATFTSGKRGRSVQLGNKLYLANGTDALAFYDIENDTMETYSGLSAVGAPTVARTVLTTGSYNNFYRVSAVNAVGETVATAPTAGDAASGASYTTNKKRDNWKTDGTEYLTVSWSAVSGATGYNIYWSDTQGYEIYLGSTASTSFQDDGSADPNTFVEYPVDDTTTGPKFGNVAISGNRIWGTLDPENPWRVYFSGTGNQLGAFSPYFGGGFVDIEKGGAERPQAIKHYRDGTGNPAAVVYTSGPNGVGSTWIIELVTATVGSTPIVIPASYKITGSNGSDAPDSLVEANNAVFGYNSAVGFNSLRTKPSQLNVLSTDEVSFGIRNYARGLKRSAINQLTGIHYDGKILWSVPNGSDVNNEVVVLDLENKNWAKPWTIGFKGFLEYAEANGEVRLLGIPTSGTKLLDISNSYQGDSGVAFATKYRSGLYHFSKSQTAFAWIDKVHVILGRPKGTINVNIIGTQRNKLSQTLKSRTITDETSNSGIGSELISSTQISDATTAPTTFASASVKKTIKVNKLLNNIQIEVSSAGLSSDYSLQGWAVEGRLVPINEPSSWRN